MGAKNRGFQTGLKNILIKAGILMGRLAKPEDIQRTLERIYPIESGHKLVRIGESGDGGYIVPDDFKGVKYCFSPGVADNAKFEETIWRQYKISSFLADYSVDAPPESDVEFDFEKKFLGNRSDDIYLRLEEWVNNKLPKNPKADLILQMDIEGSEYPVLLDAPADILRRFRIMVIEFHGLQAMLDRNALPFFDQLFAKLTRDFYVVHNHPNNVRQPLRYKGIEIPQLVEMTFLRKDRVLDKNPEFRRDFPHPLDTPCVPSFPEVTLPKSWMAP